jgi:hypothetical protein
MTATRSRGTEAHRLAFWPWRRDDTPRPAQSGAAPPLMRFLTLGGAVVELHRDTRTGRHRWECLGCEKADMPYETATAARDDANEHAGICRAMPKPGTS